MRFSATIIVKVLSFIVILQCNLLPTISRLTSLSRDQIECTMCSACDNPCQTAFSPPPPPPDLPPPSDSGCPPPPSPPSSDTYYYSPPPPSPPSSATYYYSPPPPSPPSKPSYSYSWPPPAPMTTCTEIGCTAYPPPDYGSYGSAPPPPNPIVPYFPYYYQNPPSSFQFNNSVILKQHSVTSTIFVILCFLLCFL